MKWLVAMLPLVMTGCVSDSEPLAENDPARTAGSAAADIFPLPSKDSGPGTDGTGPAVNLFNHTANVLLQEVRWVAVDPAPTAWIPQEHNCIILDGKGFTRINGTATWVSENPTTDTLLLGVTGAESTFTVQARSPAEFDFAFENPENGPIRVGLELVQPGVAYNQEIRISLQAATFSLNPASASGTATCHQGS